MRIRTVLAGAILFSAVLIAGHAPIATSQTCNSTVIIDAQRCPSGGPHWNANIELRASGNPNGSVSSLLASGSTNASGQLTLNFNWPGGNYTTLQVTYRSSPGAPWHSYTASVTQSPTCGDEIKLQDGGIQNQNCDEWVDGDNDTVYLRF